LGKPQQNPNSHYTQTRTHKQPDPKRFTI